MQISIIHPDSTHTKWPSKRQHVICGLNWIKYQPIFKIISLTNSAVICSLKIWSHSKWVDTEIVSVKMCNLRGNFHHHTQSYYYVITTCRIEDMMASVTIMLFYVDILHYSWSNFETKLFRRCNEHVNITWGFTFWWLPATTYMQQKYRLHVHCKGLMH